MITGRCECGRVRYQLDGGISDLSHCHCSMCRRLHGAAFATFAEVQRATFSYLSGEEDLKVYASSEEMNRVFCGTCGSSILAEAKSEPDALYIAMGTVDGDPECPTAYHIYVASKAPWYAIADDLDQYEADPGD